ncbi:MAG: hypothetical protein GEV04_16900 [Actinophytocola sp.]|nr:hypothetical protein [Actinophytocola sp.]
MFDTHVHAAPDVLDRIGDDTFVAESFCTADFDGFVLKGHYESTVGRARALARRFGLTVYGGLALNQHTGGVNPSAVAATLGAGGRVIWLPTADAHTQQAAGLPRLCDHEPVLARHSYAIPPVDPSREPDVDAVLRLVADHDAVLATGHLSGAECDWLVERAHRFGVRRLLLTHPSFTVPALDPEHVLDLVRAGAYAEITAYQLLHQPGCDPALLARVAEAAGERLVLSSDAGQPTSPLPAEALLRLIDTLAEEGLDRGWLEAAASDIPRQLFTPE